MAYTYKLNNFKDAKILGTMIRLNRLQQNMSQKVLCEGICVPSYLSRIENAEIIPSQEVVAALFDALAISFYDDETFIAQSMKQFDRYKELMMFGDLKRAFELYESLMKDASKYYNSPIVIDFFLVEFMHISSTGNRLALEQIKGLLESVIMHMDNEQLHIYWLYRAMDDMIMVRDFPSAEKCLIESSRFHKTGKWALLCAQLYYEWDNLLKAMSYIYLAGQIFAEEGNVLGLVHTYEIKGHIFTNGGQYDFALIELHRCLECLEQMTMPSFVSYIHNHLAYVYGRTGNVIMAKKHRTLAHMDSPMKRMISEDVLDAVISLQSPNWFNDLESILRATTQSFRHPVERCYLKEVRDQLLRSQRKYKTIDEYRG